MYQSVSRSAGYAGRDLAVEELMSAFAAATNAQEPEGLMLLMSENVQWTGPDGQRQVGLTEVTARAKGMGPISIVVEAVNHIRPDVSIVSLMQSGPNNEAGARTTVLLAWEPDGWKIVSGHTTLVAQRRYQKGY